MSSWGAGIFSDDLTADVRDAYRELLLQGVTDSEANRLTLQDFDELMGSEDEHLVWLALAAAQRQAGRLQPDTRDRAVAILDEGVGLERWADAAGRTDRARLRALSTLRAKLTGPQHPPRVIRRAWADRTDLVLGDVLRFAASDGRNVLFRVIAVQDQGDSRAAILVWLDWIGLTVPPSDVISTLSHRTAEPDPAMAPLSVEAIRVMPPEVAQRLSAIESFLAEDRETPRLVMYQPFRLGRSSPGWRECGFARVTNLGPSTPEQDAAVEDMIGLIGCEWNVLADECERFLNRPTRPATHD